MATRPTRPKGYLTKGKTTSMDAARKAAARRELTSLRGIAGLVGRSVVEGIGGPKAKAAGVAVRAGRKALSGKALDAAINKANLAARSTKPVRSKSGGLKTTTGQGRKKVSSVAATRMAEQSAGPKARRLGGETALRSNFPKPGVRITRKTSGGEVTRTGTPKKVDLKVTKRAEGPSRPVAVKKTVTKGRIVRDVKSTDFVKPSGKTTNISGKVTPFVTKEKTTVTRPVKRSTNRNGSAVTVRKTEPRKVAEVRAEAQKERQERIRKALTIRINPARVKSTPKRSQANSSKASGKEQEQPQGIMVRGKFYPNPNPGLMPRSSGQADIASRLAAGSEKATYGKGASNYDKEAERLLQRALRALESPKASAKEKVKPGVRTRTASLIKNKAQADKIKGAIRNQRRVLKEREIKEAAERIRKAEEAAKKRGTK
jgi:hypothetical protein